MSNAIVSNSTNGATSLDRETADTTAIPGELKSSIQILVIDDDRTLREGCASVLQIEGYNVTFIGRGDEALELVRRRRFDIVLLDLYMSGVAGGELLAATMATAKDTIAIVMTGNPS